MIHSVPVCLQAASQGFSIVKSSLTRIPSPLLIEIPLKEEMSNVKSGSSMSGGGEGAQKDKGGKKPVLMKRDTNKGKKQQKKKTDVNKVCDFSHQG